LLATELRRAGVAVDLASGHRGLGNSLKGAEKAGARFAVLVGENERLRDVVLVKEMATRTQSEVPREQLVEWLRPRL